MIVVKGETRTITRHVTFFKRLPHDLDADTPTPTPDQATLALVEVMTPPPTPPMTEQVEDEELQQGDHLPLAVGPEERAREPETTHEVDDRREKGDYQHVFGMRTLSTIAVKKLEPRGRISKHFT